MASLVAQTVKRLPAMRETWVQSLEKKMAIHSIILAWKTESLVGYSPLILKESDMTERLHFHFHYSNITLEKLIMLESFLL